MMRSMFSGVSGLRIHQTRMDVIANNISNVNTVGFKSSRVLFSDVFSQTVQHATGANIENTGRGGVNAMQIGLGAQVATIDRMMTQGAAQRTDHAFDLMLEGSGFLIVGDASGTYFTRNGAIRPDAFGNLLISNGMQLMGWEVQGAHTRPEVPREQWGNVIRGQVQGLTLTEFHRSVPPISTTQVDFGGNLVPEGHWDGMPAGAEIISIGWSGTYWYAETDAGVDVIWTAPTVHMTMQLHDTLGRRHTVNVIMEMTPAGPDDNTIWNITMPDVYQAGANPEFQIAFGPNGRPKGMEVGHATGLVPGGTVDDWGLDSLTQEIDLFLSTPVIPAALFGIAPSGGPVTLDFAGFTQFGSVRQTARATDVDGRSAGELTDLSIGQDGTVMGLYTNGAMVALFQIPIAEFENPAGLESVGGSLFRQTINSGNFDGIGIDGVMRGGVLEMSNVDLSAEFTDMIITQRGFQANSRTITTSDDMLQELVNLRR